MRQNSYFDLSFFYQKKHMLVFNLRQLSKINKNSNYNFNNNVSYGNTKYFVLACNEKHGSERVKFWEEINIKKKLKG